MARAAILLLTAVVGATLSWGDVLILTDGRTFSGNVAVEGDIVRIQVAYGTLHFSSEKVLRIEWKETAESQLARMLRHIPEDDPDALHVAGSWAVENGLRRRNVANL